MKRQEQFLRALESRLDYYFHDKALLQEAMSHSSLEGRRNNERLEFLGDGVLNLVIAAHIIDLFPKANEGQLSRIRAQLVCKQALAKVGQKYTFSDALILGPSESRGGSQQRLSIIADGVEAIIGAVYKDSGFEVAKTQILKWFEFLLQDISLELAAKDAKTRLQELCQKFKQPLPEYRLVREIQEQGETFFIVQASLPSVELQASGQGSSRRKAEQEAASELLEKGVTFSSRPF